MVIGQRQVDGPNSVEVRILDTRPDEGDPWKLLDREFGIKVQEPGARTQCVRPVSVRPAGGSDDEDAVAAD